MNKCETDPCYPVLHCVEGAVPPCKCLPESTPAPETTPEPPATGDSGGGGDGEGNTEAVASCDYTAVADIPPDNFCGTTVDRHVCKNSNNLPEYVAYTELCKWEANCGEFFVVTRQAFQPCSPLVFMSISCQARSRA